MTEDELVNFIRLARTEQIGPITFQRLMQLYPDAASALEALPDLSRRGGRKKPLKPISVKAAISELRATEAMGGKYIVHGSKDYPAPLGEIPDAPPVLALFGHAQLLTKPIIALVGARNASAAGRKITERLAAGLGERGMMVASGLARGIDHAAHQAALTHGTIAVLANGIGHIYPPEHAELQEAIMAQGLVICENPPNTAPQASLFPRRNRIIAGLSLGVVVVEAARRSGSLITARMAGEYGREVLAVPGSPPDMRCHGSNHLLRQGAALVENVDDVLDVVLPLIENRQVETKSRKQPEAPKLPPADISDALRQEIIALLGPVPVSVDELVERSGASVSQVHLVLLELDLTGRLHYEASGQMSLIG